MSSQHDSHTSHPPPNPQTLLDEQCTAWNIPLDPPQHAQFAAFATTLQAWNTRANLTAIDTTADIIVRHFLDSLWCARVWGATPATLVDVGSGAGFPGLPLKIAFPTLHVVLIESVGKKAAFLRHVCAELGLHNVTVIQARAETLGQDAAHREHYDIAIARAVADLRVVAEYCLPLVRIGGRMLAPRGANGTAETQAAHTALTTLGGGNATVEPVALPGLAPRTLVVVPKTTPTPPHYPRRVGVAARRPL